MFGQNKASQTFMFSVCYCLNLQLYTNRGDTLKTIHALQYGRGQDHSKFGLSGGRARQALITGHTEAPAQMIRKLPPGIYHQRLIRYLTLAINIIYILKFY